MTINFMVLNSDKISIRSFATAKEAKAWIKEKQEYHGDGRTYAIEERKTPETIRDVLDICGIAAKDRKLTVNGKSFRVDRSGEAINLVEAA